MSRQRRAPRAGAGAVLLAAVALQQPWLARYDFDEPSAVHTLERPLLEISGLAFDEAGRLFTHDDEFARVHELDPATGRIVRTIGVGAPGTRGDFEGLAIVGRRFFLITGAGVLVEFEQDDGGAAPVLRRVATGLGVRCETEGLAFEAATQSLLAPCKTTRDPGLADRLVVFAIPLTTLVAPEVPRLAVPFTALAQGGMRGGGFHPSSIEVQPRSGSFFLASAQEEAVVEISADGRVLGTARLPRKAHPQPEGIAFGPDLSLWISDEGGEGRGTLARYLPGRAAGR